jgi:peptidylprolyl isomerase
MDQSVKPQIKPFVIYILLIIGVITGLIFFFSSNNSTLNNNINQIISNSADMKKKQYSSPPKMSILSDKKYFASVTTDKGVVKLELYNTEDPVTVNNFVFLAKEGFYEGTVFHRIVKDFMIQGGDPKGDGTGGPGYKFNDEKITRDYTKGTIAMANSGPDTNGSQFFIMLKETPLPKNYVIFGKVIEGLEIVEKIGQSETVDNGYGEKSKPTQLTRIEKVTIEEK